MNSGTSLSSDGMESGVHAELSAAAELDPEDFVTVVTTVSMQTPAQVPITPPPVPLPPARKFTSKRDLLRAVFDSYDKDHDMAITLPDLRAGLHLRYVRVCLANAELRRKCAWHGCVMLAQWAARKVRTQCRGCYRQSSCSRVSASVFRTRVPACQRQNALPAVSTHGSCCRVHAAIWAGFPDQPDRTCHATV